MLFFIIWIFNILSIKIVVDIQTVIIGWNERNNWATIELVLNLVISLLFQIHVFEASRVTCQSVFVKPRYRVTSIKTWTIDKHCTEFQLDGFKVIRRYKVYTV